MSTFQVLAGLDDLLSMNMTSLGIISASPSLKKEVYISMEPPYPQRKSVRHFVPGFLGCSVQPWNPPTLVIPSDPGEIFPEPRLILSEWLSISPIGGFLNLFSDIASYVSK